jgi:hypothetical protein
MAVFTCLCIIPIKYNQDNKINQIQFGKGTGKGTGTWRLLPQEHSLLPRTLPSCSNSDQTRWSWAAPTGPMTLPWPMHQLGQAWLWWMYCGTAVVPMIFKLFQTVPLWCAFNASRQLTTPALLVCSANYSRSWFEPLWGHLCHCRLS